MIYYQIWGGLTTEALQIRLLLAWSRAIPFWISGITQVARPEMAERMLQLQLQLQVH